jgi:hypothetical protein
MTTRQPLRALPLYSTILLLALGLAADAYAGKAAQHAKNVLPIRVVTPAPVATTSIPLPAVKDDDAAPVRVERIRPKREKYATLRFFKANRDFLRARFDLLRQHPGSRPGDAAAVDPRFLAYQQLVAEARAGGDSLTAADQSEKRRKLFQSVTELGMLESQLDQMDRLLADQRNRLGVLQADFAARQRTTLAIVMTGYPGQDAITSVGLKFEDGDSLQIPLSPVQCQSLRQGGMLEVFHGLVEPREQLFQVVLGTEGRAATAAGWITLEPQRDHLTFLRLNLAPVRVAEGAASMTASTWVLDALSDAGSGTEKRP